MSDSHCQSDADPTSLPLDLAVQRVLAALQVIDGTETLPVADARGRTLVEAVRAPMAVPPFRASAMDGFALRHAEAAVGATLSVAGVSLAGHPAADAIPQGHCVRIMTGARIPDDADTVVQSENTDVTGQAMTIRVAPRKGLHVREPGSDTTTGDVLVNEGRLLTASDIGVLASCGIDRVSVRRPLRIAVLSTGDELRRTGERLQRGDIYDANAPLLDALLDRPGQQVDDLGICPDDPAALQERFAASDGYDLMIASGGVSVGDADHVKAVLERCGSLNFWKIAMKPGRPLTVGQLKNGCHFFGLPGNPVSVVATTLFVVLPAIAALRGEAIPRPWSLPARLDTPLSKLPGRVEYQRGVMRTGDDGTPCVGTTGLQDSHVLRSVQQANCLIELPTDSAGAAAGDTVRVIPFSQFSVPAL